MTSGHDDIEPHAAARETPAGAQVPDCACHAFELGNTPLQPSSER